ncbi:PREDICTED: NAP1-related protein 2-like [Nicotiana attenuata]|nr:PREDICTED: NAP1-related protein 2-like [Nicotiana attenuata]
MGEEKGNKKQKIAEKAEDEENNNFDGKQLVLCIEKLQDIQDKLEKINEEARDEVLKIAQKFSQIRKPVYEKRNDIIKTIPNFWLTAFLRHPILGNLVSTEEDHEIFKYLSSIEVEDAEDFKSGYTITFYFSPNPFFENTMLSKTYTFLEDGRPTKVTASAVQWTEGIGVAPLAEESFFLWFSGEVDQKYDEVAAMIKDELWPNPLNYFNEADEEKDLHEADESSNEVVKDSENDGDEEADEADKKDVEAADEEVVKDSENDGEEAGEEDLEAAGGSGNEVVKDSEDDYEEANEEDLEAADKAGDEGTESEGSYDDYDLGG